MLDSVKLVDLKKGFLTGTLTRQGPFSAAF